MTIPMTPYLRNALRLDAAVSAAAGLVMTFGAGLLGPFLELPQPLLFWAGVVIFAWVVLLALVAGREGVSRLILIDIVAGNALWVAASVGILVAGIVTPNTLGVIFVLVQGMAVGLFAALQAAALRSASAAHA
ncbi:hypothetical protein [Aquibium oceanicum]|uniref:SPW repeat-containing protein n=1 Tax=Aquibium oceanicum TaxID=1670800 RepID=A0A1L3SQ45_9HYPH|nr:hypothetical protein [Aquibium oceanicum]APH71543.1 hypothetical protein BSQ44_09285 [Aquibium oceanicum]